MDPFAQWHRIACHCTGYVQLRQCVSGSAVVAYFSDCIQRAYQGIKIVQRIVEKILIALEWIGFCGRDGILRNTVFLPGIIHYCSCVSWVCSWQKCSVMWHCFRNTRQVRSWQRYFSFLYAPVLLSFVYLTRECETGIYLVWLILISSWGCDTCAYVVGKLIGKKHIFPGIKSS